MTVRLTNEARQFIGFFETETDVVPQDCILTEDGERVVFVVSRDDMSQAIGPGGRRVHRIEDRIGRRVELVENASDPGTFVANALRPAAVYDVTVTERDQERVAYAVVDGADMGVAIGTDGRNVRMAARLADRHVAVDRIELVPDPDACHAAVLDETGIEPVDVVFDPEHERYVVLVPSGSLATAIGTGGSHAAALRDAIGWSIEFVEYGEDPAELIAKAVHPATVQNVTVSATGVAYVEVDRADTGVAIGSAGRRIDRARLLADRYYDIEDVELA